MDELVAVTVHELDVRKRKHTVTVTGSMETVIPTDYSVFDPTFRDGIDGELSRLVRFRSPVVSFAPVRATAEN
jgi:hypothetical protein